MSMYVCIPVKKDEVSIQDFTEQLFITSCSFAIQHSAPVDSMSGPCICWDSTSVFSTHLEDLLVRGKSCWLGQEFLVKARHLYVKKKCSHRPISQTLLHLTVHHLAGSCNLRLRHHYCALHHLHHHYCTLYHLHHHYCALYRLCQCA